MEYMLNFMRNAFHAALEVPIMSRMLHIPSSKRLLIVVCGERFALASLAKLKKLRSIAGLDVEAGL